MDKFQECAQFYKDNLLNKTFVIEAGKKGNCIKLQIVFLKDEFHHLIGLQHLADMEDIAKYKNKNVFFEQVLKGKISFDKISASVYFKEIQGRFEHFFELVSLFDKSSLLHKQNNKGRTTICASHIITKQKDKYFLHLFLNDKNKEFLVPVTFFERKDNKYTQNQEKWTILNVYELDKSNSTVEIIPFDNE